MTTEDIEDEDDRKVTLATAFLGAGLEARGTGNKHTNERIAAAEKAWRKLHGESIEKAWRKHGDSMEKVWSKHGESVEEAWRKLHGESMEEIWRKRGESMEEA